MPAIRRFIPFLVLFAFTWLSAEPVQELQQPMNPYQMEAAAVGGIRTIMGAQQIYARHYPDQGFACAMETLGPSPTGMVSAEHAGLLEKPFMQKQLDGYEYELICPNTNKPVKKYTLSAVPVAPNPHKLRAFCVDQKEEIRAAIDGKAKSCFRNGSKI